MLVLPTCGVGGLPAVVGPVPLAGSVPVWPVPCPAGAAAARPRLLPALGRLGAAVLFAVARQAADVHPAGGARPGPAARLLPGTGAVPAPAGELLRASADARAPADRRARGGDLDWRQRPGLVVGAREPTALPADAR